MPTDTPTLALLLLFELRVESVFVVLTTFTWFLAASRTSFALTFEPAIVTFPLPGVPSPVYRADGWNLQVLKQASA
ncbi:hypothetical protein PUN4_540042 [Paraburkholderia unamae]|nr:hypothetical protein PUN4_540042 [Paraburkholderia unamae]